VYNNCTIICTKGWHHARRQRTDEPVRTRFVEEALARELRRARLGEVIEKSYGAWSDEDHLDMMTGEDIDRWIEAQRQIGAASRQGMLDRLWREGEDE